MLDERANIPAHLHWNGMGRWPDIFFSH